MCSMQDILERDLMCACMQITINRPEKRNAFRPQTTEEIMRCFSDARDDPKIGVVILTGTSDLSSPCRESQLDRAAS